MAIAYPSTRRTPIYEGTRIPHPIPTVLEVDPALRERGDILEVNFGPNHPSTHGVLRLIVELNGERVEGLAAVIGYLHTGFEKNMEAKTYWKGITYAPRIDYVSYQNIEIAPSSSAPVPSQTRCEWIRFSSSMSVRIQTALGGTSIASSFSIAATNAYSFAWNAT